MTNPISNVFAPSNDTSQTWAQWQATQDSNSAALDWVGSWFQPTAPGTGMTVQVGGGTLETSSGTVSQPAQIVTLATAPTSNSRIDLVVINRQTAVASVITGTVAASPVAPNCPATSLPIAQVTVGTNVTAITAANGVDARIPGGGGGGTLIETTISTATSLTALTLGLNYVASAALALTVAQTTTLSTSWMNTVFAQGGNVTVTPYTTDKINGGTAGQSIVIPKGYFATIITDGAGNLFIEMGWATSSIATLASASTVDLGSAGAQNITVSGTTTVTSFGSSAQPGQIFNLTFSGATPLTYNATSMILPGGGNITTAANDTCQAIPLGSGNFLVTGYSRASGQPLSGSTNVPVRQTVLSGDTNASGQANFITTGSGLTPAFTATNPLVMTFANGFGASGAVDVVARLTSGATTAACTANTTNYIYATYVSAASVTWGTATLQPLYQSTAPTNTNGQYWFDTTNMQMKLGNGTTWAVVNAVFVGEAVAGASTISSVVSYAFQGQYIAPWTNTLPGLATVITASDNLGTPQKTATIEMLNLTAEYGFSVGDITSFQVNPVSTVVNPPNFALRRNSSIMATGETGGAFCGVNLSSGASITPISANWAYRIRVKRSF